MTIYKLKQQFEIKFWDILIPMMEEEGPLMKMTQWLSSFIHTKTGYLLLLIFIFSALGFAIGLNLGRMFWMLQYL